MGWDFKLGCVCNTAQILTVGAAVLDSVLSLFTDGHKHVEFDFLVQGQFLRHFTGQSHGDREHLNGMAMHFM